MTKISKRIAVVFGGGSGLGLAILHGLRNESYVALPVGRRVEQIRRALGDVDCDPQSLVADITDSAQVGKVFDTISEKFGKVDVVINSSGTHVKVPSEAMSDLQWDTVMATNLRGAFLISREAFRAFRGSGSLLHISSINGEVAFSDTLAYCTSKAGMNMLVKSLARDWAKKGIRVNAIAPGVIPTDLNRAALADEDRKKRIIERSPMGKLGTPDDLVGAALYLVSDAASYVTGVVLPVDGGFLSNGL